MKEFDFSSERYGNEWLLYAESERAEEYVLEHGDANLSGGLDMTTAEVQKLVHQGYSVEGFDDEE